MEHVARAPETERLGRPHLEPKERVLRQILAPRPPELDEVRVALGCAVQTARRNVAPFSVTRRKEPFTPSCQESPQPAHDVPSQICSCSSGSTMRVDHRPGDSSNQASGCDRSAEFCRIGLGPVPYQL